MTDEEREAKIDACARAAHEANRSYCIALGDLSQHSWEGAPEWQRTSSIKGVEGVLAGNGPRESHAAWLAEKFSAGWSHGPRKDPERKEHPCFLPYDDLPEAMRRKDVLFVAVVRAMALALDLDVAPQRFFE